MGIEYETLAAANKYTEDTIIGQGAIKGDKGDPGPKGDTGEGVPTGGTTGQVLVKSSNADYDTEWGTELDVDYVNDISSEELWENGTYDDRGNPVSSTTRLRASYIEVTNDLIIHLNDSNYEYAVSLYSDIGVQLETAKANFNPNTNTTQNQGVFYQMDTTGVKLLELFPTLKYIRMVMRNSANTAISPSDCDKITINNANNARSLIPYLDKISKIFIQTLGYVKIKNAIDSLAAIWSKWSGRLGFGMDKTQASVPLEVDGQIYADGTIIAHNTGENTANRWGYHIYEGYSKDNYSRMTMVIDKHNGETPSKPTLEYYYYTGSDHSAAAFGNTKIGSDVIYHSFLFNRDVLTCNGVVDFKFPVTLARIAPSTLDRTYSTVAALDAAIDPEGNFSAHLSSLKYIYLKNAENGAMFYDTERNKVVCKINGAWCDLAYTDASSNYSYL